MGTTFPAHHCRAGDCHHEEGFCFSGCTCFHHTFLVCSYKSSGTCSQPASTWGHRHPVSLTETAWSSPSQSPHRHLLAPRLFSRFPFTGRIVPSLLLPFPGPCVASWTNKDQVQLLRGLETVYTELAPDLPGYQARRWSSGPNTSLLPERTLSREPAGCLTFV